MKRILSSLSQKTYDVAVIGGGIYGLSVARDAALRGLSVALVEQGDFGSATSSQHHKIIHGGLRYLQHADFKRMRESIRERTTLMRIAPHLVHPMPFLVPTYARLFPGKLSISVALKLNDLISFDRNWGLEADKCIPRGRLVSKADCLRLWPDLAQEGLTGGMLFYDGQVVNPDRLNLSLLWSAVTAGADAVNYTRMIGFQQAGKAVTGIQVKDDLSGDRFAVRARVVVNCSGPWTAQLLQLLDLPERDPAFTRLKWLKAVVLVTRALGQHVAIGIPGRTTSTDHDAIVHTGHRYFFITPWRQTSLIGTFQAPYDGDPSAFAVTEQDIQQFLHAVNEVCPRASLRRRDVYCVYGGLLPRSDTQAGQADVQLTKHYQIYDHALEDGIHGLISVVGVKYTTARDVAEKTVNRVMQKLGKKPGRCRTATAPVHGGAIAQAEAFTACALAGRPAGMSEGIFRHLLETYGSEYQAVLRYGEDDRAWCQPVAPGAAVSKAEVRYGVQEEMARKLGDIIFRRTDLGTAGYPGDASVRGCAEIMAAELGWDADQMQQEIQAVRAVFSHRACWMESVEGARSGQAG